MTFIDSNLLFHSAAAAYASGADVTSTNIVDQAPHLAANAAWTADEGAGEIAYLVTTVTTAFSGGTSMQVVLQPDTNNGFATAKTEPAISFAYPIATLVAGYQIVMPIPPGLKRYLRVAFRNVGANTAGAVTSYITKNPQMPSNGVQIGSGFVVG